jgi:RNA polymerase sigma-70 factor (ECF subfamily)
MTLDATDEQLVANAKAGDLAAFEELTLRHERQIYSLTYRILRHTEDAEDATQQAFLSALENLGTFRGESPFGNWLSRIASHAALKILRKRQARTILSLEEATGPDDEGSIPHPEFIADWRDTPERLAHRHEVIQLLDKALGELDEKHRLVFVLRDVQGFSIDETAQALGISEANVKVRLLRARLQLRERLTRVLGDPATFLAVHQHS